MEMIWFDVLMFNEFFKDARFQMFLWLSYFLWIFFVREFRVEISFNQFSICNPRLIQSLYESWNYLFIFKFKIKIRIYN